MKDIRHDAKTAETDPNLKDLTCNESQLEELLSGGESTEGNGDDTGEEDKPAKQKLPR